MTRLNLWKAQLKAARSILKIHQKDANAANRALHASVSRYCMRLDAHEVSHL